MRGCAPVGDRIRAARGPPCRPRAALRRPDRRAPRRRRRRPVRAAAGNGRNRGEEAKGSEGPVSRILCPARAGLRSFLSSRRCHRPPATYPGARLRRTGEGGTGGPHRAPLFGLAPHGVCRAPERRRPGGALLPHPFTLAGFRFGTRRSALCCTFRRVAAPRRWRACCPWESGLSSPRGLRGATASDPPTRVILAGYARQARRKRRARKPLLSFFSASPAAPRPASRAVASACPGAERRTAAYCALARSGSPHSW